MRTDRDDNLDMLALLETHHKESFGWALNCCSRSAADAEIVLQKVYVKILEGKARFDRKSKFKTWLFAVIRKTAADRRRRKVLHSFRLVTYEEGLNQPGRTESLDETVYQSELQALLRDALGHLPRRQQEVLFLVFYHDLPLADAAIAMQVSIGSARTHYERGKKQLRKWMEEAKVFDESELGRRETKTGVSTTEKVG